MVVIKTIQKAKFATKAKGGGKSGVVCHNCGKPGHKSPDCRQGQGGGGGKGGIVCHNCGKPGHKSPDCRQGQRQAIGGGGGGGGIVCHTCGKPGHKSPDCRQGAKGGGGKGGGGGDWVFIPAGGGGGGGGGIVCHTCGKPGHKSPDCRQGAKGGGGGGGIVCHTCGKAGHKSPDCRQGAKGGGKGKKGGGKGKGKRNISMVRRAGKTNPEKNVWFGGLAERDTHKDADLNKKLQAWINKSCGDTCKFVDVGPKGNGGAIFGSEEEASAAISTLNGQKFMGKTMEFDVWVQGFKYNEDEEVEE